MRIDSCEFPDDLLYDEDGLVWARVEPSGDVVIGITTIYAAVAGRPTRISSKPVGVEYERGKAIANFESGKYFGPIRSPVAGRLLRVNEAVLANPRLVTDSLYNSGWIARLRPTRDEEARALQKAGDAEPRLRNQIAALHVRCFAAFPDFEMVEIGTECAAVLSRLNELLSRIQIGDVVHVVSDDLTAPIEMTRWSDQTGQPIIDERREGNLFHFLVRKVS